MMNEKTGENQVDSQHIIRFKTTRGDIYSELVHGAPDPYMLIEDLHTGVIPYTFDRNNSELSVTLAPDSKDVESLICDALTSQTGYTNGLNETVCEFIRQTAHSLVYWGTTYHEIVYLYREGNSSIPIAFELVPVDPNVIRSFAGIYYQLLPKEKRPVPNKLFGRIHRIDKSRLLITHLPPTMGSPSQHRKLLKRLARAPLTPGFAMLEMGPAVTKRYFDHTAYQAHRRRCTATITQHLGWTARGAFSETTSEFYRLMRHLRFLRTKAELREHLLNSLNQALQIIGRKMNFKADIQMTGLTQPSSYDNYMVELRDGKLGFAEAWRLD